MKYPSFNIQAPENAQAPSARAVKNARRIEIWSLVILGMLELGAWSFLMPS
jgi:hypothetical protein